MRMLLMRILRFLFQRQWISKQIVFDVSIFVGDKIKYLLLIYNLKRCICMRGK